ncbi:autotransporter assembly complex protein TamA [Arvimicrobium flavum]|uniref:autotransporter assembly complex protein TamA n=1 Tax=Arvimicrobium flavum TaxID=3393320 RepID=UPI00398D28D5
MECLVALGLSLGGSTYAHSFEIFGIKIFGGKDEPEDTIGEPYSYSVDFAVSPTADEADLEKRLKGASTLWQDREEVASGAAGLLAKARGDYRRLLATLYSEGRYGGTISIRIDGREAADLAPDATIANPAKVQVSIDPGPLFRFRETDIVNRAPATLDRKDQVPSPEEQGFVPGEIARSGTIVQAGKLSVEAWRQQGFAKAELADRRVVAAHDRDVVDATLVVEPGRKAHYGAVSVEGVERMDPEYVAWMTALPRGAEYDPDDIKKASDRLARLEVFRAARIQEAEEISDDGSLPVAVIVQERLPRRFGFGGSYSTVDGLGLEAYWMHRNLFGRAERLRFEGKISGIGETFQVDELTYRLATIFTKPGVYTPDTDFVSSLIGDREVLDAYTRSAITAAAGFTHKFSDELSGRIYLNGGYAKFWDDVFGRREFQTVGLLGGINYDSRNNPTDATSGYYADVEVEPFYEFNYGNPAARFTAEGRAYYALDADDRFVVAGRLKVGSIVGPSIAEIAPDKLFFAGGGGSVRGYEYRNIGVETPAGLVGGRSLIEASAELRTRVTDSIGVVAFADAGYVGADSLPDFSEQIKVGAGLGLRYLTALGPIRLDVAVPLNPGDDDPDIAFYVGIGQAF